MKRRNDSGYCCLIADTPDRMSLDGTIDGALNERMHGGRKASSLSAGLPGHRAREPASAGMMPGGEDMALSRGTQSW